MLKRLKDSNFALTTMPFIKRTVEPVNLSDKPVPKSCRNELETVSNFTLCGLIRQLACLADQANSVFDEIGIETKLVFERTNSLILCVEKLKTKVHNLDARAVKVPESNLDDYSVFRGHYHAQPAISKDLFTEHTRPHCVKDLRSAASTNFTDLLRKCKEYQNDRLLVKSVMETRWLSAQDQIESQYELDVCKHVNHVLPKQRRKQTVFADSSKGGRPLSDGDIPNDQLVRSKAPLPTPEQVARQNVLPSSVISIDVTGCSFQRMSSLRRSDGKKNKRSSLRRRTIGGTPADVHYEPTIDNYNALPIVGLELNQDNISRTQSLDRSLILRRQSFNDGQYAIVQPIGTRKRPLSLRLQKRPKSLGKYEILPEGKHVDFHGNGTSTVVVRRNNKKEDGQRKGARVTMPDHPDVPSSCLSCETLPPYNSADSLSSTLEQALVQSSPIRPKSMELDRKHLQVGQIPKSASAEHIKRSSTLPLKTNSSLVIENNSGSPLKGVNGQMSLAAHSQTLDSSVKLRGSRRQDERQSSSGNWSESDSNRNSLQSDTNQSWISDASSSLTSTCDSAVSMNCPEKSPEHDRSSSDVSQTSDSTLTNNGSQEKLVIPNRNNSSSQGAEISMTNMDTESWLQSVGAMHPVLETAFGNQAPMQKQDYDLAMLSDTCSSSLTSIDNFENESELSDDLEIFLGQSGSDVFDSSNSLCSIDTDGYWTSMHSDCGLPSMSRKQTKYMPPSAIPIGYTSEESESGSRHSSRTPPRRTSPKMRLRKKKSSGSPSSDRGHSSPKIHPPEASSNTDSNKGTKARPTSLKLPNSGPLSPNSRSSSPGFSDTTSDASSYDLPEPMRTPTNGGLYTICFTGSMQLDDMIKCTSERTQQARSNSPSSMSSASYDDSPNSTLTRGSRILVQSSTQTSAAASDDNPTHSDLWKQFDKRCEIESQYPEVKPDESQNSISGKTVEVPNNSTTKNDICEVKNEDQSTDARKSYYDHRYGIFVVGTSEGDNLPLPPPDSSNESVTKDIRVELPTTTVAKTSDGKYLIKPTKSSINNPDQVKTSTKNDGQLSPPKFVTPSPRLPRKTVMMTDLDRVLQWNESSCGQPVVMVPSGTLTKKAKEPNKPVSKQVETSKIENIATVTPVQSKGETGAVLDDVWQRQQPDGITETDIVWQKQSPTQIRSNKLSQQQNSKEKPDLPSPSGFGSEGYDTIKRSPRQKKTSTLSQPVNNKTVPESMNVLLTTSQSVNKSNHTSESIHVSIPTVDFGESHSILQLATNVEDSTSILQPSEQQVQRPNFLVNNNDIPKPDISNLLDNKPSTNQKAELQISGNEATHHSPLVSPIKDDRTLLDSPDSEISQSQDTHQNTLPALDTSTLGFNQYEPSPSGSPVIDKHLQVLTSDNQQKESDVLKLSQVASKDANQPPKVHIELPGTNSKSKNDSASSYIEFETGFGTCDKVPGTVYSSPQQTRRQDIFVQAEPSLQLISPVEKKAKNDSKNSFRNSYREELQNSNNDPDLAIIRAAGKIGGQNTSMTTSTPIKGKSDSFSLKSSINGLDAYNSPKGSDLDISYKANRNNSNHIEEGTDSSPTQYVFDPNRKPQFSILKRRFTEPERILRSNSKERLSFMQASKRKSNLKSDDLHRKAVMASLSNAKGPFGSDSSINSNTIPTKNITFSDTVIVDHTPVKVCQVSGKPQTSLEDFRYLLQQQSPSPKTESAASALNIRGRSNRHNATELLVKSASLDRSQINGFPEPAGGIKVVTMNDRKVMESSSNYDFSLLPNPPSLESPTESTKKIPMLSVEELTGNTRQSIPIPPPDATFTWLKGISPPTLNRPSPGPSRSLLMEEIRRQSGSDSRLTAINQIDRQLDKRQGLTGDENDCGKLEFHGLFNSISTKVKKLPSAESVTESEHDYPTDAWD